MPIIASASCFPPGFDGEPIHQLTPPPIAQRFMTLEACEEEGPMEWDLCSGNLLVDRQEQPWLFDFGYMHPFDPLQRFTAMVWPTGRSDFVERFETRFFFSWPMTGSLTPTAAGALSRDEAAGGRSYRRKLVSASRRRADPLVPAHFQQLTARWSRRWRTLPR